MITYNNIETYFGKTTEYKAKKNRSILKIATRNGHNIKCDVKRFEVARKLYNLIKKLNNWKDNELEYDSEFMQKEAKYYCNLQCEMIPKAEQLAKSLDLELGISTWYYLQYKNEAFYI